MRALSHILSRTGMRAALVISAVIWFAFLGNDIWKHSNGLRKHFTATVVLRIAGVLVAALAWCAVRAVLRC